MMPRAAESASSIRTQADQLILTIRRNGSQRSGNPYNEITSITYNGLDRELSKTLANGQTTSCDYDQEGRETALSVGCTKMKMRAQSRSEFPIIGYDLRVSMQDLAARWDGANRERHFFRPDIAVPLSVDRSAWPSMFDSSLTGSFSPGDRQNLVRPELAIPDFPEVSNGWWLNLDRLLRQVSEVRPDGDAILVAASADEDIIGWGLLNPDRRLPDPDWEFAGYDVATEFLISGLLHYPISIDYRSGLAREFGPHLNSRGLFANIRYAKRFMWRLEEIVPTQAFFTYGLHILGQISESHVVN